MVRPELIEELKQIIKEDYNLDLSATDASDLGNSLVEYFGILAKNNHKLHKHDHEHNKKPSTGR